MPVNANKPERWQADIAQSVGSYNDWFFEFAPETVREARRQIAAQVREAFKDSAGFSRLTPQFLRDNPEKLTMLRTALAPPVARDRLGALALVGRSVIIRMETLRKFPVHMSEENYRIVFPKILAVISELLDRDIFPWLDEGRSPAGQELERAVTILADRLSDVAADHVIRDAQEQRQLDAIRTYLEDRDYRHSSLIPGEPLREMEPGTFALRDKVFVDVFRKRSLPMDVVVQPHQPRADNLPILVEAQTSDDFLSINIVRKYEAKKMRNLRKTYGNDVTYVLFLDGYFDNAYLNFVAGLGIDWIWEHRIDDLGELGI